MTFVIAAGLVCTVVWKSARSPSSWKAVPRRRTVVSCPAEKRLAAMRTTSMTSGNEPSGKVAVTRMVKASSRGFRRQSST